MGSLSAELSAGSVHPLCANPIDTLWAPSAPLAPQAAGGCGDTVPCYCWCVNVSVNALTKPQGGFGVVLCTRPRAGAAGPSPQPRLGNVPGRRRGYSTGTVGERVPRAGAVSARPHPCPSSPSGRYRNARNAAPSHIPPLRLLPGRVPGLSGMEERKSRTSSEGFIFSKKATSSLLTLAPVDLPEGPRT